MGGIKVKRGRGRNILIYCLNSVKLLFLRLRRNTLPCLWGQAGMTATAVRRKVSFIESAGASFCRSIYNGEGDTHNDAYDRQKQKQPF